MKFKPDNQQKLHFRGPVDRYGRVRHNPGTGSPPAVKPPFFPDRSYTVDQRGVVEIIGR